MPWTPTPTPVETPVRQGWSPTGPVIQPPPVQPGWSTVYQRLGITTSIGDTFARVAMRSGGATTSIGVSGATLLAHLAGTAGSVGTSAAIILAHLRGGTTSTGNSGARAALPARGGTTSIGTAAATILAHLTGTGQANSRSNAALVAHLYGLTQSQGNGSGTAQFSPQTPATTAYATPGNITYTIPAWSRYIDGVAVGSGAGGEGGGWFVKGKGGGAGQFAAFTIERGIDIPWSQNTLTGNIPAGGSRGNGGAVPSRGGDGSPTTIDGYITANGGTNYASSNEVGLAAGNYTHQGRTYSGGGQQTSAGQAGQPPGGGAAGGNTSSTGGVGAPGGIWFTARQT